MKKVLLSLGLFLITLITYAQRPQGAPAAGGKMPSITGRIYGKIVDASTKKPIEFASVVALRTMGKKDTLLGGGLTLENGDFNIENVPLGPIKIKVTFLGYKDFIKPGIMVVPPDNVEIDLGDISLESDAKVLNQVEVTAQKSTMQMNLDKKVFNVDKNITATGGTAEDVLKNVPSVSVDADGNAKLRNNNTIVYVDGRPTMLSINQIPADQIESVEVISNPSAKFEASATGGIINIVTKKNRKPGYNGFVALGVGTGNRYNGTLNLNVKEGRTNVTGFYNVNASKNPTEGYAYRTNYKNGIVDNYYNQNTSVNFNNLFQVGRLGLDYQITNRNTLTLTGTYVNGNFNIANTVNDEYLSASRTVLQKGSRVVTPENEFKNYGFQALWKKTFAKKGKELTADLNYGIGNSVNAADWLTTVNTLNANGTIASTSQLRNVIDGGSKGNQFTFQLDYTNPINDSTKIEMGIRSYSNLRDQDYLFSTNINDKLLLDSTLSSKFEIDDYINAAYLTYGSKLKGGIAYQAGVRFEASNFDGNSILNNSKFGYKYPSTGSDIFKSFFPSLYLSKKLSKTDEIQLNFSRKINRPGFMQLMPVIMNNDRQNIRQGNPNLKPEFINLAELNYNKIFGSHSWLGSVYFRGEESPILSIARQLNDSITLTTFENGKATRRIGMDNTFKFVLAKDLEFTTNLNTYNINITTDSISRNGWTLEGKSGLTWKLPKKLKDFSIQVNGNYETKRIIAQGERLGNPFMDIAIKYTFMRVAGLTLSVNDVFNSRKEFTYLTQPNFYQESMRRRDLRFVRLSLQMPFGKMDASIFRKAKDARKQGNNNQGQEMDY